MSRQLKPLSEKEAVAPQDIKREITGEETVRVITTDQLILNRLEYLTAAVENLNLGLSRLAKQGGFDLTKD